LLVVNFALLLGLVQPIDHSILSLLNMHYTALSIFAPMLSGRKDYLPLLTCCKGNFF
jgi:hypothetical protein